MRFPSKLLYVKDSVYEKPILFISDSGNNRVLVVDEASLTCIEVIGSGIRGDEDGTFENSKLYHP